MRGLPTCATKDGFPIGLAQGNVPLREETRFLYGVNRAGVCFIQMCVQHRDKHNLKLHEERSQLHRV